MFIHHFGWISQFLKSFGCSEKIQTGGQSLIRFYFGSCLHESKEIKIRVQMEEICCRRAIVNSDKLYWTNLRGQWHLSWTHLTSVNVSSHALRQVSRGRKMARLIEQIHPVCCNRIFNLCRRDRAVKTSWGRTKWTLGKTARGSIPGKERWSMARTRSRYKPNSDLGLGRLVRLNCVGWFKTDFKAQNMTPASQGNTSCRTSVNTEQ